MNNIYDEYIIKKFVQRRRLLLNIANYMIFVLLGFALVTQLFFRVATLSNTYNVVMVALIITSMGLKVITDSFMSTCPICHMYISTASKDKGRRHHPHHGGIGITFRIDVGPLPDICPHCGTRFDKY